MSQGTTSELETEAVGKSGLPPMVAVRLDGELSGQTILGWSEFDLDSGNRFARQFVVLTDREILLIGLDGSASLGEQGSRPSPQPSPGVPGEGVIREGRRRAIALEKIEESRIVEGLGVDRLVIVSEGKAAGELRYSRRHRTTMTRLNRKLQRQIKRGEDSKEKTEKRPEWLDAVEREAERKTHCPKCGELIPSYAEGVCPQCAAKRKILWRLLDVAKPYKWRTRYALVLTIAVSAMAAIPAWMNRQLVDRAIAPAHASAAAMTLGYRMHELVFWSTALLVVVIVSEWLNALRLRTLALMGEKITADLRHKVYEHLHDLSLRYFSKRRTGSLITRVTSDTDRLWDFIVFGSIDLIRDVAMIAAIAAMMFKMNWELAAIALLPLPVLGVLTYKRGMKMQRMFGRLWTYYSRMSAVVGDALPGVRVVKAFANEQKEIRRFDRRSDEYTDKASEIHIVWTALAPWVSGLMRFGALLIWVIGGWLVIRHPNDPRYTLGVLIAFTQFVWQFYQPIMELANSNRMVTRAATSASGFLRFWTHRPTFIRGPMR